jgi:predicted small lipoprotein YifL
MQGATTMKISSIVLIIGLLSLTACGNDNSAASDKDDQLYKSQVKTLDKTRNIENVLQQSAGQRQRELDNQ